MMPALHNDKFKGGETMRDWLKAARKERGLTMAELGSKLKISESYYSQIESGTRQKNMDITLVRALSDALGISIKEIVEKEASA